MLEIFGQSPLTHMPDDTTTFSVRQTLRGKNILLTGASGFVGKVWLCMALSRIPEIGKIHVVLRRKAGQTPHQRLERMINSSPVFKALHETYGAELPEFLNQHLRVIEGDVSADNFGFAEETISGLSGIVDLVLNCAGLVDFSPDIRAAFKTNVCGGLHALDLARVLRCPLLHISTAFVASQHDSQIKEQRSLSRESIDATSEYLELEQLVNSGAASGISWVKVSQERADKWGYPNGYAYTKSLAESVILDNAGEVNVSIFRPTIVESALKFPFSGWNEGTTTCAPLSYFTSKWMRLVQIRPSNVLDVIPVDMVCEGITTVAAALLSGRARQIYHCGTSHLNPLNLRFALELIDLSHREYTRAHGESYFANRYLSRFGSVIVNENSFFTVGNMKKLTMILLDLADLGSDHIPTGVKAQFEKGRKTLNQMKWDLIKAERAVETFSPYLTEPSNIFETRHLRSHLVEESDFQFRPEALSWSHYIVNIHEPGLRKWCYPLMEGKQVESYQPAQHCCLMANDDLIAGEMKEKRSMSSKLFSNQIDL